MLTEAETTRATRRNGEVVLTLADGKEVVGDEVLVATGRRPGTHDVGLETVGLAPGEYVPVDDRLRAVGVDGGWLYAVGDVNGRALLTRQGKYQARLVGDLVAGIDQRAWADQHAVPRVAFTDPQVAAVGRTERRARDDGIAVETLSHPLGETAAGALHGTDTVGTAQLVIDVPRRVIVGATFTGPGAGELLHAATVAIAGQVTLEQLWHAVPAFPPSAKCGCASSRPNAGTDAEGATHPRGHDQRPRRGGRRAWDPRGGRQARTATPRAPRAPDLPQSGARRGSPVASGDGRLRSVSPSTPTGAIWME